MIKINVSTLLIKYKKSIVILFFMIALISGVLQSFVSVNYDMVDYLPEDAPSVEAMNLLEDEFAESVTNTRVMVKDVTIQEALQYKQELTAIDGVSNVMWLDDAIDLKTPIELADEDTVENYYKDQTALFSLTIADGNEVEVTNAIYELIGEENAVAGEAVDTAVSQKMTGSESFNAAALLVPIVIIILVLSTSSWLEPVFFLIAIGVSILINLGTNIFLGEVSFVTQSVSPILQLAVSLDYAIFLLHSFQDHRKHTTDIEEAMRRAMKQSFPAIAASAATTFFGFMALTLMDFEIGADLGLNLVKGILFSFISVVVFLPALTLWFYKWIDRTQHKSLLPSFKGVGHVVMKFRIPSLVIVFIILVPGFIAQSQTNFIYGSGELPDDTRAGQDTMMIEETFGKSTPMVVLVPKGDVGKETALSNQLKNMNHVTSIISYPNTVGSVIPSDYLDDSITEQFYSDNYTRMILYTDTDKEGEITFSLIDSVQETVNTYYDKENYLLGESVTLYDIKNIVTADNKIVNIMTIVAIVIVLLVTFKSITLPIILLVTIQTAVWINLSIPYFTETPLVYVGYLIVSTVQLAATVDYAILLSENYTENRKQMPAFQAIKHTINQKIFSISISASILSSVGFILAWTSSNPIVSSIGLLLGRGALLAFILVVFFLPAMLFTFDTIIRKTSWKANFFKEK
ncbi:Membrane protein YdfJ [Paraliobacillus sp. PM-2]|uniref:efflux RND transporter permease subunit n=1 Tax=Paraliobacillus sp. PM-2 TaxID=1462524 RepID=UPI00061C4636|nr:MMPL family transporter [Paraliobacillus sp. PM-2]CQR46332.1 Membrane protein YdfJ [Paraliobacillus sp. PM-2]